QCQKTPVGIERELGLCLMIASLMVGEEDLAAPGDPFDLSADPLRRPRDQHLLGVDEILGAEAAADIRRDKAQLLRFDAERAGGMIARRVQALRREMR